ncbi:hypothetical protein ACWT_0781 [Actinoplanes sp. SE50]|uniref:hypothetical protein n=1 Tax=unclassified Actinoplanes TaxID=2626549 RepID=UPI00023EBE71|nr:MULTISPECIES: hypothetical protein [unclassified Actinoplanes]AEV81795.1 hypothetical protein ACPL_898 [Actinoplanes sp. SE50/110]ATO80196.1 hypothetical protein ACWT_0781 [Actinoplanes sp. SE50]SLL97600.1 hypothetical protein ACSP50_0807 [Actinoplanes sp. SE50/110]
MVSDAELIEKRDFSRVKSIGSHRTLAGFHLVRCEFDGSSLAQFDDPGLNLVVRDARLTRCVCRQSSIQGVRLEDVLVDGVTMSGSLNLHGCALRHVTLRGRVGRWFIMPPNPSLPAEVREAFMIAIQRFYRDVDWALDISAAEFTSAQLHYVPGELVRRDPETQFLLRRHVVEAVDPAELPSFGSIAVSRFETTPLDCIVAAAPKRSSNFAEILDHLQQMRNRGLAE